MKKNTIKLLLLILTTVFILFSCEKENNDNGSVLVNKSLIKTRTIEELNASLTFISIVYPGFDTLKPYLKYTTDMYKFEYRTSLLGKNVTASGLAIVPQTNAELPVLSFQNGTNTCDFNTPSSNTGTQIISLLSLLSGSGYIIIIPDYIGFGSSGNYTHPYIHKVSSDQSIIDMLLATTEFIESTENTPAQNGELHLLGYSQGGWATLSLLNNLENSPIENYTPKSAMAGAGVYNLNEFTEHVLSQQTYSSTYYLPFFIYSRIANGFFSNELSYYLKEPYATETPAILDGSLCLGSVIEAYPQTVNELATENLLSILDNTEDSDFLHELSENSLSAWNIKTPLRMFHSMGDKSIPYTQSQDFYNKLKSFQNENETQDISLYLLNDTLDHTEAYIEWGLDAINWLLSRN